MKWLAYLCLLLFSLASWAGPTYLFLPEGKFCYESTNYGDYYLTGKAFHKFNIYEKRGPANVYYGTVTTLKEWTRAYRLSLGSDTISTIYSSFFSWGSLYDRLKQFEVYNEEEQLIGTIEGKDDTKGAAEFLFYDSEGVLFAVATVDGSCSKMTITNSSGEMLLVCSKTLQVEEVLSWAFSAIGRHPTPEYFWTIEKTSAIHFDARFFWPFMAFICDIWWKDQ